MDPPGLLKRASSITIPFDIVLENICDELSIKFSVEVRDAFEEYVKENEFDLESLQEDLEITEESLILTSISEKFNWDLKSDELNRFYLVILEILDPRIGKLTRIKSVIARSGINSELLVAGYLRETEALIHKEIMFHTIPSEIKRICLNYFQLLTVYGIGRNDRGEFGMEDDKRNKMQLTELEWITKTDNFTLGRLIPCSLNAIAYISIDSNLWLTGFNKYGQFGLGHDESVVHKPAEHPFYKKKGLKIFDVSHGQRSYHIFVTTMNGEIYAHGANEWGQCGINQINTKELQPIKLDILSFLQNEKDVIVDITTGIEHSLFLTKFGNIYCCGHNKWGQLACNYEYIIQKMEPEIIEFFLENNVKRINCGDSNGYCIDDKNNLWSWGRNEFGELGSNQKNLDRRWMPKIVSFFKDSNIKIKKFSSGSDHCLVLSENGKVYAWGFGRFGNCGDGSKDNQFQPKLIKTLARHFVIDISCGSTHSIAITDKREIWSWGYNAMNQCCIDTFDEKNWLNTCKEIKKPRIANTAIAKKLSENCNVIGIRTATNSTLFIVEPKLGS